MSKWSLLKAALSGKREHSSSESIHRFEGFQLVKPTKVFWRGFVLVRSVTLNGDNIECSDEIKELIENCNSFLEDMDTTGCELHLQIVADEQHQKESFLSNLLKITADGDLVVKLKEVCGDSDSDTDTQILLVTSNTFVPSMKRAEFWSYPIPAVVELNLIDQNKIVTREKPKNAGVSANGLLSNKLHGLDNTGNVRVWTAESLLLKVLCTENRFCESLCGARILELGGGMTGLCGIGLALNLHLPTSSVVITDGHPDCVKNQKICIQMSKQSLNLFKDDINIETCLLRWSKDDILGDLAPITKNSTELFDVIIAADCLFFKDFHDDLIWVLQNSISMDGIIYLLQPTRSNSMALFAEKAALIFHIEEIHDYSEEITQLHQDYLNNAMEYNPDIHLPVLLVLKLKPSVV